MTPSELKQILDDIHEAFPYVKRRFHEAPRVLEEWTRALRPLAIGLVEDGISRWIRCNNMDPTLDTFLGLLDAIAEERRHKAARGPVVIEEPGEPPFDAVPVAEVKALLADLYVVFDQRQAAMDNERRQRRGPSWQEEEGAPAKGAPPTCSLRWPMMSLPEAKALQVKLLERPQLLLQCNSNGTRR